MSVHQQQRRQLREEPAVRADGRCARHGCTKLRHPERSARYAQGAGERDPFCSTECAKAYYGVQTRQDVEADGRKRTRPRDTEDVEL